MADLERGTVVKSTGSWYQVELSGGSTIPCRIRGKFRLEGKKLTNPVAVGDEVMVRLETGEEGTTGLITQIFERKNYVVRQSPRRKHDLHLLASNVDQAAVVVTLRNPNLKQGFIDRFLLMTEPYNIPTLLVFNKADLYNEEDMAVYDYLRSIYRPIGYDLLLVSALSGLHLEAFTDRLKDRITLIGGQSGVGKSTLIMSIQPQLDLRTAELSGYSGKGQHTTTFAQRYPLDFGGYIIDTPGIKTLAFNNLEPLDVAHNFREFFERSDQCRFGGKCLHRDEPGCAVKQALDAGEVSELRYINYLTILEEIEEQNYWERHREI